MHLAIGSDHAGYDLKSHLINRLQEAGYTITDHGPTSADSVDYPDFAHPVADQVEKGEADLGLLMCGSGNGINMSANKHAGVRSALCWLPEIAALARQHNNANVLCLAARFTELETAKNITNAFLSAEFEAGRHERRVAKIPC